MAAGMLEFAVFVGERVTRSSAALTKRINADARLSLLIPISFRKALSSVEAAAAS